MFRLFCCSKKRMHWRIAIIWLDFGQFIKSLNVLIYNFVAVKNLNLFFKMTSNEAHDLIYVSEVPDKGCEFLITSDGKGGLTHFYVRQKKVFQRVLLEMCRSWSVECDGKILQLNFNRHKALGYVNDAGELVLVGVSIVKVDYATRDGGYSIKTVRELPWKGGMLVPLRERQYETEEKEMFFYPGQDEIMEI